MNNSKLSTFLLLAIIGLSLQTNATTVSIDTAGLLSIPSVQVGSINYSVELQLIAGEPISFELGSNISETQQTPDAQYQNNILSIPDVAYGSDRYIVELLLIEGSTPTRFQLSNANLNCSNCVSSQESSSVSGLTFNFNESTPGFGETLGSIHFKSDGTFFDDATNNNGHFVSTGSWTQNGNQLSIHFTFYQYDGEEGVTYDGSTLTGQVENNQGSLSDGYTTMNLTSLITH